MAIRVASGRIGTHGCVCMRGGGGGNWKEYKLCTSSECAILVKKHILRVLFAFLLRLDARSMSVSICCTGAGKMRVNKVHACES